MLMVSDALTSLQHVSFSAGKPMMRAEAVTVNNRDGLKWVAFPELIAWQGHAMVDRPQTRSADACEACLS
jgi:hypothetical protein